MKTVRQKKIVQNAWRARSKLPKQGAAILLGAVLLSLFLHLSSFFNISYWASRQNQDSSKRAPITIKLAPKKTTSKKETPENDPSKKKIVEVKQNPTEKPKESQFKSFEDHKTDQETRIDELVERKKAADAGDAKKRSVAKSPAENRNQPQKPKKAKLKIDSTEGTIPLSPAENEAYRQLLPSAEDLSNLVDAGYQEYLDDEIAVGDRIDINTTNYRYMGYMTSMRKSIELVWNYPIDAVRRGMQGEVGLEFIIEKNGDARRIRVIKSSGYKILDDAILEAIQLAAPFSPLPEGFAKDRIVITGMFRYILSSFLAGAH